MQNRKRSFEERLNAHPHLRDRVDQLLAIVEDAEGDIDKADEAERRVIEELRRLGQEVLEGRAFEGMAQWGLIPSGIIQAGPFHVVAPIFLD